MKESKILKLISYLSAIILLASLILSFLTIQISEDELDDYFNSNRFVNTYFDYIYKAIHELIHYNDNYISTINDGNIEIHYENQGTANDYVEIKDYYYLIIYENIALTNVEITNTTNTIENIKLFIKNNENSKYVDIIYGKIDSNSEIIHKKGIQYLDNLRIDYYIKNDSKVEYIYANERDYQIYTSYKEDFKENSELEVMSKLLEKMSIFQEYSLFIIPTSSTFIVLILIYLIISIGYEKNTKGISLNDFDKIPLEIILFVTFALGILPILILSTVNDNYKMIISLIITEYFLICILSAIIFNTVVKRIKSRTFFKSSIIGRIVLLITSCLEKLFKKYKEVYNTVTYSTNITKKVFIYFGIVIPIGVSIFVVFKNSFNVLLLEFILASIVAYRAIRTAKGYQQIENKLKEMYEGNNKNSLNKQDFGREFHSSIKYINDISSGFENAIQDRIKGERLKAELITNVSHDIKTPLTSIINYVDLLKQENIQNEKAKEYIGILDNKSQRLKKLTEDLVEASKVSTGNIALNLENINIVELIKQAIGEFEDKFQKKGLEVNLDYNESNITINADNKHMYRIIENLFSNISKYALENSRVYIDINKSEKGAIIQMKNISKDKLNISSEELLQRFVRGDKSRTTEGSGLGISIAQNLTELQGGKFNLILDGDLFKVELEWKF